MPPRVQAWKNALLDLTLRNKLLNLRQPMTQVPLLLPAEHLGVLADQLQDGRTISVRAVDDLTGAVVTEGAGDAYALPGRRPARHAGQQEHDLLRSCPR